MKTIFSKLMPGLLVAATGFAFTACGDDDEPKVDDKFSTEYIFTAELNADLLKTADVKAYVLSPEGSVTEETVTKAKSTWTLNGNSIPDKAGVLLEFQPKSGDFSGEYEIEYKVNRTVTCLNNGSVVTTDSKGYTETFSVSAENIRDFWTGTGIILSGEVNASGKASITNGDNLDFGLNLAISRPEGGQPKF